MIIEKIKRVVEKNLNNIFYFSDNEKITYKELYEYALEYSDYLKREGTGPVIIYGHKELYVVLSIVSCLFAKRCYVPVGSCTPLSRLEDIIKLTKASLVITDYDVDIKDTSCIKLKELSRYKDNNILENNNDKAYMIFTSGSTGIPKGVPISYSNLNNFIEWISNLKPLNGYHNVNVLNQASFSFDLSVADFYYSLCNGHTLYAFTKSFEDSDNDLYDLLKNIDVAVVTPTFMKLCLLESDFNSNNYSKFKCVYFCGEQLEKSLVQKIFNRFPNINIINAYGPSEATSAVCASLIAKDKIDLYDLLPCGDINSKATNIEIIEDKIVLSGDSVFQGYIGDLVGGYFKKNGINYFNTGDIGYIKDSKLYCKGRSDNQVKYKGYRIELTDIEENINKIKGVKDSIVVAKKNESYIIKTIQAYVEVENGIDVDYVREELEKLIPAYMMPKTIKIIDKIPVNNNGKKDRKVFDNL